MADKSIFIIMSVTAAGLLLPQDRHQQCHYRTFVLSIVAVGQDD
jgi:hypothetical protein